MSVIRMIVLLMGVVLCSRRLVAALYNNLGVVNLSAATVTLTTPVWDLVPNHLKAGFSGQRLLVTHSNLTLVQRYFQLGILIDKRSAQPYKNLAVLHWLRQDYDCAIRLLSVSTGLEPDNAMSHFALGNAYAILGAREKALGEWRRANATMYFVYKGMLYTGDNNAIAEEYSKIAVSLAPHSPDRHAELAHIYRLAGNYDSAINEYQVASTLEPERGEFHYGQGLTLWYKSNRAKTSVEIERYISAALRELELATQLKPEYYPSHVALGSIYEEQGELAKAREWFIQAEVSAPEAAAPQYHLGRIAFNENRLSEALSRLQLAITRDPLEPGAHLYLARTYVALGKANLAINEYRQAIRLLGGDSPDKVWRLVVAGYYRELAAAHEHVGDIDSAVTSYVQSLRLDPRNLQARDALIRLEHKNRP